MKECTHCGGPNAPENRVCDYCGMGFDESTIPEGSIDPREQAKLDAAAWKEANREKDLIEFNLNSFKNSFVVPIKVGLPGASFFPTSLIRFRSKRSLIILSTPTPRIDSISARVIGCE